MREILFRGKNEAGIWHYGAYLPYESGEVAILESFSKYGYEAVELSRRCKVIPETVGQYTGLTDKNGKKIFEGDTVLITDDDGNTNFSDGGIGDVEFYDGLWYVSGKVHNGLNDLAKAYYIEVIGNIYF